MFAEKKENHVEAARAHLKASGAISRTISERINHVVLDHLTAEQLAAVSADLAKDKDHHIQTTGIQAIGLLENHGLPHHEHVVKGLSSPNSDVKKAAASALKRLAPHFTTKAHVDWALDELNRVKGNESVTTLVRIARNALERKKEELLKAEKHF